MSTTQAWGVGIATVAADGTTLDTYFRHLGLGEAVPAGTPTESQTHTDPRRGVSLVPTSLVIDTTAAPTSASDVYLRLHLLSHRLAKPRTINLDGAFGLLANVAWTSIGPVALDALEDVRYNQLKQGQQLVVNGFDKFPRMTDYVVPSGVRIADASRVRLGGWMVEGRCCAGVIVGDGSDIGGGASIMGTLSGGGKEMVTVGEKCLLGANSGLGISLGNNCVIEAGLYVTAGTQVKLPDGATVKARELSGANDILFRRNSLTGAVEVVQRTGSWGGLNAALHKN